VHCFTAEELAHGAPQHSTAVREARVRRLGDASRNELACMRTLYVRCLRVCKREREKERPTLPAPLSCSSQRCPDLFTYSPRECALPSPS
jgi:hypothetical protein